MTDKMQTRAAAVSGSLDAEARTITVVFATETPVRRHSWELGGRYDEILLCKPENLDLSRADNMSLLDSHGAYSLDDRLGSVVPGSIRFEKGQVTATVKLSRRAKAEELFQDLQDGMSLPISVGYRITQEETTEAESGGVPTVRALKWQPLEISVVPVPADPGAKTRSEEETFMPNETTTTEQRQHAPNNIVNERRRISDIRAAGRIAGLEDSVIDQAIERGDTVESFRNAVFETLVARQNDNSTFGHVATPTGNGASIRSAMADALMVRIDPAHKPQDDSREFIGLSLGELARRSLDVTGVATRGLSTGEVIARSLHTTSDFGHVVSQVGQTVLAASYKGAFAGGGEILR